jgi:hypothetical protein
MRGLSAGFIAALLSCGAAAPQSMSTTPAAPGATSPLGIPGMGAAMGSPAGTGMTGTVAPAGIGLGATEISPGGLSPTPTCSGDSTYYGMTSTSGGMPASSTFDGGGVSGVGLSGAMSTSCPTAVAGSAATGAGSPASAGSGTGTPAGIALGSTEIGSAGVSPMIGVPTPSVSIGGGPSMEITSPAPPTGATVPSSPPMSSPVLGRTVGGPGY